MFKATAKGLNFSKLSKFAGDSNKKVNRNVSRAVQKIAFNILRDAKRNAPIRTGALRASGRVLEINKMKQEIEFGGSGTGVNYAAAIEYGTGRISPKPFLRPAVKQNQAEANRLLIKAVQGGTK